MLLDTQCDAASVRALVIPSVTKYEPFLGRAEDAWKHLRGQTLADPWFGSRDRIDVLLDANIHAKIIEGLTKGQ